MKRTFLLGPKNRLSCFLAMVISVEVSQVSLSAIARALAINTFLGWMRPGRNCMPSSEAYENLRVGLDAVITHWQLENGKILF